MSILIFLIQGCYHWRKTTKILDHALNTWISSLMETTTSHHLPKNKYLLYFMPLFLSVRQSRLVAPLVVCNVQLSSAVNTAIFSSFIFAFHLYVLFVNSNAHIMFVFFMEKEININLHTNRLEYHLKSDACALVAISILFTD